MFERFNSTLVRLKVRNDTEETFATSRVSIPHWFD